MTAQTKDQKTKTERTMKRVRSPNHVSVYANNVQIEVNLFDIKVSFGELMEAREDQVTFEDKVTVIFSPQHAKVLAAALLQNIGNYEKQFGIINIPKELAVIDVTTEKRGTIDATDKLPAG